MKGILSILLWAIAFTCFGQLKHDVNWVFGHNAGLDFSDPDTVVARTSFCANHELAASFSDSNGKMNHSLQNMDGQGLHGGLLIVSQFTLAADIKSGNRPGFTAAAEPEFSHRTV